MSIYYTNTAIDEESNIMLTQESRCHDRYQADFDYHGAIDTEDDPADVFRTFSVTRLA